MKNVPSLFLYLRLLCRLSLGSHRQHGNSQSPFSNIVEGIYIEWYEHTLFQKIPYLERISLSRKCFRVSSCHSKTGLKLVQSPYRGGNFGIGRAASLSFALEGGANVILASRSAKRLEVAKAAMDQKIAKAHAKGSVETMVVDMANMVYSLGINRPG